MLILGWWNAYRANLARQGTAEEFPASGLLPPLSTLDIVRESLYAEIHWAFYRAVPLTLITDPYWATLVGAAIVVAEWVLDPAWRAGLANGSRWEALLAQGAWLALSSAIFILARNIWPIILLHTALAWGLGQWVALLRKSL